ncbi:MAG: hypothetical protein ACRCWI_08795 [Brevinema sp.]
MFAVDRKSFWNRLYTDSNDMSLNIETRRGAGLSMDTLEGDAIFVATKLGIDYLKVRYNPSGMKSISSQSEIKLKVILLYYNCIYDKDQREIVITSTSRTAREQAK